MRMFAPVLTTPPAITPVSLEEAKSHLRVDHSTDDTLITSMIEAATAHFDGFAGLLGRCLIEQVWTVNFADWPASGCLRLPFPNVSAVTVKYRDVNNAEQTVSSGSLAVLNDERGGLIRFSDDYGYPAIYDDRADPLQVVLTAGYGDAASDVPAPIRAAILLLTGHLYQNRESVVGLSMKELPMGVHALVAPYRRVGV